MKGLSTIEADLIKFLVDCPPSSCHGPNSDQRGPPLSAEQLRAVDLLIASGRAVQLPCPNGCGDEHVQITSDGLLAYRLDSVLKT
jgi:hypothetical protein